MRSNNLKKNKQNTTTAFKLNNKRLNNKQDLIIAYWINVFWGWQGWLTFHSFAIWISKIKNSAQNSHLPLARRLCKKVHERKKKHCVKIKYITWLTFFVEILQDFILKLNCKKYVQLLSKRLFASDVGRGTPQK